MSAALPVVSFLCVTILAILIPLRRVRGNIANLAIVSWLLGCNFVHGINSILWSSNVDLKAFAWCDLVTKLVLATTIAIPGACLCNSGYLEAISSSRNIPSGMKAARNRRLLEAFICYFIPLLYIPLSIVGQDYRFNIAEGLGCMASIHSSTPACLIVWLPHMAMCVLSLVFSGVAIRNSLRLPATHFSAHLEGRSPMNSSLWTRSLTISIGTTSATMLVIIFSMFSLPTKDAWISWAHVHEHLAEVSIVGASSELAGLKTVWWGVRAVTICYIALVLILGEESREIVAYIRGLSKRRPQFSLRPLHRPRSDDSSDCIPSLKRPTRPVTLELKSGWDDDLNIKSPKGSSKKSLKFSPPSSPSPSPSPSAAEYAFLKSTMPYMGTPMGNPLGFNTPVLPSPVYKPSTRNVKPYASREILYETPHSPVVPPAPTSSPPQPKTHNHMESKASNIAAMLEEYWPIPPLAVPSPVPSSAGDHDDEIISPTRASSPALSIEERRQAYSYSPASSAQRGDSGYEEFSSVFSPSPIPASPAPRGSVSARPSFQSLRGSRSRENLWQEGAKFRQ